MPTSPYLYAADLINVLKKKHASGTYKSLVHKNFGFHRQDYMLSNIQNYASLMIFIVCRYFTLKHVSLEAYLKVFFLKAWIYMQPLQQIQKRVAGERTVRVIFLVLPQNMKPV